MAEETPGRGSQGDGRGASKSKEVDALLAQWTAAGRTPGAAVRVIRHGTVTHAKEYGLADIEKNLPITPNTAFLLASLTKPFTALAVMILVEKGELSYDARLSEFFPDFPHYARTVSVRHLLHHTSGFGDYRDPLIDAGLLDPDDPYPRSARTPPSSIEPTCKQALAALARQKDLLFVPGEEYRYSNAGYLILAQIVEQFASHSYPAFLNENIFGPAGMAYSEVPVERWREVARRAVSYRRTDGAYEDIDYTPLNLLYGEDGIYSTVEDIVRWDQALYTDKLVKQSSLDAAFTPGILNDGWRTRYGYGWEVEHDSVFHSGDWLGFNTSVIRYRSRRLTVIVLANCQQIDALAAGRAIARIYLDAD
jgi:CubicO group peptidase (beta-lactamase class C family)